MKQAEINLLEILNKPIKERNKEDKEAEEETLKKFLSSNQSYNSFSEEYYFQIFKILLDRRFSLPDHHEDYPYFLPLIQVMRLLSRDKSIQCILRTGNDSLTKIEILLLNLIESDIYKESIKQKIGNFNFESLLENIVIEILSILKRFIHINPKDVEELSFLNRIIEETEIFDKILYFLNSGSQIVLTLLHIIICSLLSSCKNKVYRKFLKRTHMENLLKCFNEKSKEKLVLDILIDLIEINEFTKEFLKLEGYVPILR